MPFGKYAGENLHFIQEVEPGYFGWCRRNLKVIKKRIAFMAALVVRGQLGLRDIERFERGL